MTTILSIIVLAAIATIVTIATRSNLPSKMEKAEEFFKNDDYQKASEIIKTILSKKKDYVPALYLRSIILQIQKQFLMAISELNSILSISDFNKHVKETDIHQLLAELYNETQQWEKEIEEYTTLLRLDPDNTVANHRMGQAYYKNNDYSNAREYLTKAAELDPSIPEVLFMLGVTLYELSQYSDAEEYLLMGAENPAFQLDACYYLGSIYNIKKNLDEAIEMFEKSKNSKKFFIQSLYGLGEIYYETSLYDKAIETLEKGLDKLQNKKAGTLDYRYLLAECYECESRINDAIEQLEKIIKTDNEYMDAKSKLKEYKAIIENNNMKLIFDSPPSKLQALLLEIITRLNFNVISKDQISTNEFYFKAFNIKRINDPQILVYFNRTTIDITETQIINFYKKIMAENCKKGIFITTSKYSQKAKVAAGSRMIELLDSDFLDKTIKQIEIRKPLTER